MSLEKPENYKEVPALQDGETVFAEDHNQILANIEKLKGGKPNEVPVSNLKELKTLLNDILSGKTLTAAQVTFDNEEAKLIYKKYNFPKFKTNIKTINLVLTDENGSSEYTAVIEKEENHYRMKSIINNFTANKMVCLIIKSINGNEDLYYKYSVLGQFFDINKNTIYELDSDECIISDMDCPFVFNLSVNASNLVLSIVKSNFQIEIPNTNYNIILNIKNKQLNKLDSNIYFLFIGSINPFKLKLIKTDNNKIKLRGHYIYKTSLIPPICYSPILENYFNIISDNNELINTEGITSSSGKPKKFGFMKYNNIPKTYYLQIHNEDNSEIDTNEIITFDLTPDKNAEAEVKEKVIETVQDAIEALSDTYYGAFDSNITEPSEPGTPPVQEDTPNKEEPPKEPTYDFPKFKTEIPETIEFISGGTHSGYVIKTLIAKKDDGSYVLQYKYIVPFQTISQIMLYQTDINLYKNYSTINQFFETVAENEEIYYDALEGEIVWEEITNIKELQNNPNAILPDGSYNFDLIETRPLQVQSKFKIQKSIGTVIQPILMIKNEALEEIQSSTSYVLTLNIKNRVLRNDDTNIFASSYGFLSNQKAIDFYHLRFEQDNNIVKLKGEYIIKKEDVGYLIAFYSPIIENYFDTSDINSLHELKNTSGITSSSGKPLKFAFAKTNQTELEVPPYLLFIRYQDDTDIQLGETITLNLTPDKNYTLDLMN
ncbi:hypothetical protein [Brachyspira hampsonii]|uniref:hypothetical protein n=1 Tax=Brachyspira hampsonii TaxID=1287055 RepID=UPI000D4FEE34|nr:hypothetical protein [Brachyspira hampsonii]PTY39493.1 hypothetical protein DQ06_02360 [Brachyspira hampsonii bv. II]